MPPGSTSSPSERLKVIGRRQVGEKKKRVGSTAGLKHTSHGRLDPVSLSTRTRGLRARQWHTSAPTERPQDSLIAMMRISLSGNRQLRSIAPGLPL